MSGGYRAKVRMYRHGLGDCFLISLPRDGEVAPYTIMIDCGVILGTPDAQAKMRAVVADVAKTTKGADGRGKVDLLIATHEHWDHLSGFVQAPDELAGIDFAEVWLAWTEDPNDPQAKRLAQERGSAVRALQLSESRLRLAGAGDTADQVGDFLTSFFGVASGSSTSDALEVVRGLAKSKPPRYCSPSDPPVQPPGTSVQLFVLGPPRDEQLLKKTEVAASSPETYGLLQQMYGVDASIADLSHFAGALETVDPDAPFDPMQTIPFPVAQAMPFFMQRYFGSDADPAGDGPAWRRVDSAFLDAAPALALQLDNATNNTSLVLAIQLQNGDVLLFPADAQVGNWLSWQNTKWSVGGGDVTGPDLLKRAIFYKVGHHGSHNATLKAHGLELMDSLQLAMIPVNVQMARQKNWNRMPLTALVDALKAKTNGAVVQADLDLPANARSVASSPDDPSLWYEVTIP
ncbi:MAG: hypothetical protein JO083_01440 [Candidatus Eremiobacteraeota bacterium]|nr:hypothetical protein [Candidatus Eremiobacteraeota bacterium]